MLTAVGPCPGCGKPIGYLSKVCGDCASAEAHRNAREEAALNLWVSQGVRALEQYLAGWAAFSDWLQSHHPPV